MKKLSTLVVIVLAGALLPLPTVGAAAYTISTSSVGKLTARASGLKFNDRQGHCNRLRHTRGGSSNLYCSVPVMGRRNARHADRLLSAATPLRGRTAKRS